MSTIETILPLLPISKGSPYPVVVMVITVMHSDSKSPSLNKVVC